MVSAAQRTHRKATTDCLIASVRSELLKATAKFLSSLQPFLEPGESVLSGSDKDQAWISYTLPSQTLPQGSKQTSAIQTAVAEECPKVSVLKFDETTGQQLITQQLERFSSSVAVKAGGGVKATPQTLSLPWAQWYDTSRLLGSFEADKATALAVLGAVHEKCDVHQAPLDLLMRDSKVWVVATCDLEANTLKIPPCVPRASQVYRTSDHPAAVMIKVQCMADSKKKHKGDKDKVTRENCFLYLSLIHI